MLNRVFAIGPGHASVLVGFLAHIHDRVSNVRRADAASQELRWRQQDAEPDRRLLAAAPAVVVQRHHDFVAADAFPIRRAA